MMNKKKIVPAPITPEYDSAPDTPGASMVNQRESVLAMPDQCRAQRDVYRKALLEEENGETGKKAL